MALKFQSLKKFNKVQKKIKDDLNTNKITSKELLRGMKENLNSQSRFRLLFAVLIIILVVINPLLVPLIAGLGFIGSLISSALASFTFLSALEPLYSGILAKLVQRPITFFIIGVGALLIGLQSLISFIIIELDLVNLFAGIFNLILASLFFHYFLKYHFGQNLRKK